MTDVFSYRVLEYRVIDGDSVKVVLDQGFFNTVKQTCRIIGVDTPELRTPEGKLVKRAVEHKLSLLGELRCNSLELDKFNGRFVGTIYTEAFDLSTWLLETGLARHYEGGRKPAWDPATLKSISDKASVYLDDLFIV